MRENGLMVVLRRLVLLLLCALGNSRRPDESPRVTADKMKVALNKLPEKQRQNIQSMVDGGVEFEELRTHMALQNPDAEIEPILRGFAVQRAKEQSKMQAGTGLNRKRSAASKRAKQVKKPPAANAASKDAQATTNRAGRPRPPTPPSKNSRGRPIKNSKNQKKSGDRRDTSGAKDRAKINTLNNQKVSRRGVSDGESSKAPSQRVRKTTGPVNAVASKGSSRSVRTKQGPQKEAPDKLLSKPANAPVAKGVSAGQETEVRKAKYSKPSVARSSSKKRQRSQNAMAPAATSTDSGSTDPTLKRAASKAKSKKEGPSKNKNKKGGKRAKPDASGDSTGWPAFTLDEASTTPLSIGEWYDEAAGSSGEAKPFAPIEGITARRLEENQQDSLQTPSTTSSGVKLSDNVPSRELAEVEVTESGGVPTATTADTDVNDPNDADEIHADFSDEDYFYDEDNFDEGGYDDHEWSEDTEGDDVEIGGDRHTWRHWRRDDGSDDWQEDATTDFYDLPDTEQDEELLDSADDDQDGDEIRRYEEATEAAVDAVPA